MAHKHTVRDTNAHFTIDLFTRQVKNDSANKTTIVQYDHNSERLTFEMPLYNDGHAMTLCNLIELHFINISANGDTQHPGTYEVTDIKAEGDKAIFTWLISQEATQLVGSLNFLIVFKCVEDSKTVYRWSTEIFKNLSVSSGMDNGEAVLTEYPDILAQWKTQLFDASNTAVSNVATAEAKALAAIEEAGEAKKQSVLDSIPDEYEALSALADKNHRNKASAIVLDAEGESIVVNDASAYPLQNLRVFGKSTQDGTPTPDAPVEIVSVGTTSKIRASIHGKNLLPYPFVDTTKTLNGITFTDNGDGTITINGTAKADAEFTLYRDENKPLCKEGFLHGCPVGGSIDGFFLRVSDIVTKSGTDIGIGCGIYCEAKYILIRVRAGVTANNLTFAPMVNDGLSAMPFEKGAEKQEIEVATTNNLHGIPVSSGGNYTDANGQQWICDEVDLARGVYVRRIENLVLDGTERFGISNTGTYPFAFLSSVAAGHARLHGLFTHGKYETISDQAHIFAAVAYSNGIFRIRLGHETSVEDFTTFVSEQYASGNPVSVCYVLATPIETPLSEAEINAFKALHSNKPNTTILNDAGAYMAIEYVADTKTYIDNKIAEALKGSEQV